MKMIARNRIVEKSFETVWLELMEKRKKRKNLTAEKVKEWKKNLIVVTMMELKSLNVERKMDYDNC